MAVAAISGTPAEILRELPVTEPLVSGFQSGLFQPKGALYVKDAQGCTKRNRILINIATKKPKVGKNCVLSGGEWLVDFGMERVTTAKDVVLLPLMPDNYVYAQGAYAWTEEQRRAYGQSYPTQPPNGRIRPLEFQTPDIGKPVTALSRTGAKLIAPAIEVLGTTAVEQRGGESRDAQQEGELAALRKRNPALFDAWTVQTLLNAKAWGLSFGPGTYDSFEVTIEECAAADPEKGDRHPCTNDYTVPNQAARYDITPVPMSASIRPVSAPTSQTSGSSTAVPTLTYGEPTGQVIDRSLFGIHAPANWFSDLESGTEGPTDEATIPDVPVGYLRLWDTETTWADIEPVKGQFTWRKLERQIQTAQITDSRVMLVLGGTPAWAGDGSRQSPPTSIADWRNYVRTIACRFGPSISAYEIWNEANLKDFWGGTAEQMADLTSAAFEEIRGCENSNALVVAANTTVRASGSFGTFYPEYLEALKARGWPVDAYSVHSYPTASGGANDRIRGIGQFKTMLALAGARQTTIFDTEVNYGLAGLGEGKVDLTGDNAMALMSRTYIDSARYGFASTFWFVWTANPDSKFGIQFTRAANAEKTAWRTTYDWLVGAQFQRCLETDQQLVVCQFSKGGGNFSIVWHGDVGSAPVQVSTAVLGQLGSRLCDLSANCDSLVPGSSPAIGFKPMRIDGAPLPAGATPVAEQPASADPSAPPSLTPAIVDVNVVYAPSNKADAIARWIPPVDYREMSSITYSYEWQFCNASGSCTTFSKGTVRGGLTTTADLQKGPGKYRFVLRAQGCRTGSSEQCTVLPASESVQEDFTMLSSRAAPPSNVVLGAAYKSGGLSRYEATWDAPRVPTRNIKGYQVQVRGLDGVRPADQTPRPWEDLGLVKETRTSFSPKNLCRYSRACQIRVRTVMNNGLTSTYAASDWVREFVGAMPGPRQEGDAVRSGDSVTIRTTSEWESSARFPFIALQLRYITEEGEWMLARSVSQSGYPYEPSPELGVTSGPLNATVTFSGEGLSTSGTIQIREINARGDLRPSEWQDVRLKPGRGTLPLGPKPPT